MLLGMAQKPNEFYSKLAAFAAMGLLLAIPSVLPLIEKGDWGQILHPLGVAILTGLAYSLDPNKPQPPATVCLNKEAAESLAAQVADQVHAKAALKSLIPNSGDKKGS